ncbi:unnamed protein product, partial [Sphacelaria rigidula]
PRQNERERVKLRAETLFFPLLHPHLQLIYGLRHLVFACVCAAQHRGVFVPPFLSWSRGRPGNGGHAATRLQFYITCCTETPPRTREVEHSPQSMIGTPQHTPTTQRTVLSN